MSARSAGLIERTLNQERLFVVAALCAVIIACWAYVLTGAGTGMSSFAMTSWSMAVGAPEALSRGAATPMGWTASYAVTMVVMWWAMMIAMMLPSAAPVILLHAKVSAAEGSTYPSVLFISGYVLAWGGFSLAAATTQWLLESAGMLSPFMMNTSSTILAGSILVFAGAYQLSPLKRACLRHCQSPLGFLTRHWQSGTWGALRMGLHHGLYCLGCCAGLMAILFFGGIMNLYWIGGLAILVLLEKLLPPSVKLYYLTGPALILWGLTFFIRVWS